jgi:hypothetical protein
MNPLSSRGSNGLFIEQRCLFHPMTHPPQNPPQPLSSAWITGGPVSVGAVPGIPGAIITGRALVDAAGEIELLAEGAAF